MVPEYSASHIIVPLVSSPITVYGTVVADTIKTISSNKGGILEYIDCQAGKEVKKNTLIAKITSNAADANYKNGQLQLQSLQSQLDNVTKIYALTQDTLTLQKNILYDQYQNNVTMLDNLSQSESHTDSSLDYQEKLLNQQYSTLKASKSIDLEKMQTSISNAYKQNLILIKDALKRVNDVFGNDALSVSDKNPSLKENVVSEYTRLNRKVSDTMSSSQFSQYLLDMSELMSLAARSIQATTPSAVLPQSSSV